MEYTTRTLYGAYLDSCKKIGAPFVLAENTTLNEKFGIQAGVLPDAGVYPIMQYFGIGIGGHYGQLGADNTMLLKQHVFAATNAALYHQLPFVLRLPGNDLPPAERQKYALRRLEDRGGTIYIAYYLRRLDLSGVVPQMSITTVQDGQSNTTPFVPDSSVLNPVPMEELPQIEFNDGNSAVFLSDGVYVNAKAQIGIILSQIDVQEFLNVIDIMFADRAYAMISELALCSGLDKVVQVTDPGYQSFNMKEAIGVQINDFINAAALLQYTSDFSWNLDVGASEPLTRVPARFRNTSNPT